MTLARVIRTAGAENLSVIRPEILAKVFVWYVDLEYSFYNMTCKSRIFSLPQLDIFRSELVDFADLR